MTINLFVYARFSDNAWWRPLWFSRKDPLLLKRALQMARHVRQPGTSR